MTTRTPLVGILMGSESDLETLEPAEKVLRELDVPYEIGVISAHRTPDRLIDYVRKAEERGLRVLIGAAGGAAHLPGVMSALTPLPVLGVPVQSKSLQGLDSLLSMVQMPGGVPTATFAIGSAGAANAALFAARILALHDAELRARLDARQQRAARDVVAAHERVSRRSSAREPS